MSRGRVLGLAANIALGWGCFAHLPAGQAQAPELCVLSGTVISSPGNRAIAQALVSFNGPAAGFRLTDAGGSFQIPDVPCGRYSLSVSKPGFLHDVQLHRQFQQLFNPAMPGLPDRDISEESPHRPQTAFISVEARAGAPPERILLAPLSSLGGSVVDQNGEPLQGLAVQLVAARTASDSADYAPVRTTRTDDRGRYLFLDLVPGDYVVRLAGEVSYTRYFTGSRLNLNNDHRGIPPVYYPSGESPSAATVMHIAPGEEGRADFQQTPEPAFDIDGSLDGFSPGKWTRLELYRDGDQLPLGAAYVNLTSGQFRVVDAPRGAYILRAVQYEADPPAWLAGEMTVVVSSAPVRNVRLQMARGQDIPVSLSYEAGAQPGGQLRVTLQPLHTRSNTRQVTIGEAPKDLLTASSVPEPKPDIVKPVILPTVIPDRYRLVALLLGSENDYVASAVYGDVEILHGEFSINGNEGKGIQISVRGDSAKVEGKVSFQGRAVPGATVFLTPVSSVSGSVAKIGFSEEDGAFRIQGVAPGTYRILAQTGSSPAAEDKSSGEKLTVKPGERLIVNLEAVVGGPPQ